MTNRLISIIFILLRLFPFARASSSENNSIEDVRCPPGITFPCACVSLSGPKLGIHCSGGSSLHQILRALEPLRNNTTRHSTERPMVVDVLRIEHTPIPVLYLDSLRSLPPVRRLLLHNCSLAHLLLRNSHNLGPSLLDSVHELSLAGNDLARFDHFAPALAPFRVLRVLSLAANRLEKVPAHTFLRFHSRNRIEELDLSGNLFNNNDDESSEDSDTAGLPPEAFLGLGALRKLSLDKNQLRAVPVGAINELDESLEELYLGANRIERMPRGDGPGGGLTLGRLRTLSLDANKITNVNGESLRGLPSLLYLYLTNNRLPAIPPSLFAFIRDLKVLSLSQNPIRRVEDQTFQLAPSLLRLELAYCQIAHIHPRAFWPMPKLQFVHLGGNKLEWVGSAKFAHRLPFLVSLDLSNNMISRVGDSAFADLVQLQMLDLSGNRIARMGPATFEGTFDTARAEIRELNLIGNPLDCHPGHIEWSETIGGGVRLRGSCAQPAEMRGVPLGSTRLAEWLERLAKGPETTIMTKTTLTTTTEEAKVESKVLSQGEKDEKPKGTELEEPQDTKVIVQHGTEEARRVTKFEKLQKYQARKVEKPQDKNVEGPTGIEASKLEKPQSTKAEGPNEKSKKLNGQGMEAGPENTTTVAIFIGTSTVDQSQGIMNVKQQVAEYDSNMAVLVLVIVLIVLGVSLSALLIIRQMVGQIPGNRCRTTKSESAGRARQKGCWEKIKMFRHRHFPRSSSSPSSFAVSSPPVRDHFIPPPAMLTTLNYLNNSHSHHQPVDEPRKMGKKMEQYNPQRNHQQQQQQLWRIRRELHWV